MGNYRIIDGELHAILPPYILGDELYHHGVKGMRWGHRKRREPMGPEGSERTSKKLNELLEADKKGGLNRAHRMKKLAQQYDKLASKDIRAALKSNDQKTANNLLAARTYVKVLTDRKYMTQMLNDAVSRSNVKSGEEFSYNFIRDNDSGTVKVSVNGVDNNYVYAPDLRKITRGR